ncbi:MAG: hypothetical protein K8L99_12525 [Anaerolineae bacterium]|nr:hypothetical protein [Anaerolineae bacterium]
MCDFCHHLPNTCEDASACDCRPFLQSDRTITAAILQAAWHSGHWGDFLSPEQTALHLSQVTAAHILPRMVELPSGTDLVNYRVDLRAHMSGALVSELRMVLPALEAESDWKKVGNDRYVCVIGAGVAACLDATPDAEVLYLRYASDVENMLFLAGRTLDLPRSRLFLQTALDEKFDLILKQVRNRMWLWLCG